MTLKLATLFLAMVGVTLQAAATKNIDKTLPLKADGSVTLRSHNGSIHVHTWDRAEIEVHARIEAAGGLAADLQRFNETNVLIEGTADAVRIISQFPEHCCSHWTGNRPEIHYSITAPRQARWDIGDHNSRIEVRDVHAALELNTHNGTVQGKNLNGPLTLRMHNGRAEVDFGSFAVDSRIETHNTDVELALPAASKFKLLLSSHNAGIHSDFPLLTRALGRRNRNIDATVNGGGPELRFTSHNGSFRLRSKS